MSKKQLPTFDQLPKFHEWTGCAWDVWGKDDELGTINLLTEDVVAEAAKEIKYAYHRQSAALDESDPSREDWGRLSV